MKQENKYEKCALGEIKFYDNCECCDKSPDHICYSTKRMIAVHLEEFRRIFDFDNGRLEEKMMALR